MLELAQRVSDIPSMDQPSTIRLEDGLTVKAFENRRIQYKQDYRFMLLRHWNLFESMLYSPYVAGSLRTWTDKGRGTLKQLLAEMGIPLEQCQDKFSHMPPATSEGLLDKFTEFAPKYGERNTGRERSPPHRRWLLRSGRRLRISSLFS